MSQTCFGSLLTRVDEDGVDVDFGADWTQDEAAGGAKH